MDIKLDFLRLAACASLYLAYEIVSTSHDYEVSNENKINVERRENQLRSDGFNELEHHDGIFVKMTGPDILELKTSTLAEDPDTYRVYNFGDGLVLKHDVDVETHWLGSDTKHTDDVQWTVSDFEDNRVGVEFKNSDMQTLDEMLLYFEVKTYYEKTKSVAKKDTSHDLR
jgi:hypothetical protein